MRKRDLQQASNKPSKSITKMLSPVKSPEADSFTDEVCKTVKQLIPIFLHLQKIEDGTLSKAILQGQQQSGSKARNHSRKLQSNTPV